MTYNLWNKELTQKYRPKAIFKLLFPKMSGFNELFGLIDDRRVMGRFSELYGDQGFSDTKIPLHILATDFTSGEQVQISHGRLIDAVRASIAIPIIFKPEIIDGRVLVDGGLADLMPVDVAIKEGADIIIALGFEAPLQKQINSVLGYTSQVTSIMFNNLLRSNFAFHNIAHHKEILTIIPRFEEQIGISEDSKVPTLIKEGAQAMEEQLPYLKKLLEMDVD